MEALPRFNKLRRASGPAEIDNNRIRFYPVSYSRRVGFTGVFCVQSRDLLSNKNEFFPVNLTPIMPHGNELSINGFLASLAPPKLHVYTKQIDYDLL
jgi:hypothetical protein